ncbi:MAG: glycosyltransferase, partial [Bacteroidota bacterium]|nr:glycosyltransferase [Bacteroidota bacterium]
VITPFSYRRPGFSKNRGIDPLNSKVLEHRIRLFEMITLPSMKSQVSKDFIWIIVVDPEISEKFRLELQSLIFEMGNIYLHNFSPEIDQNNLNWLKSYINPKADYIATTRLDSDDGLFKGFTDYIRNHINMLREKEQCPPLLFFGCKEVVQWDFFHSENAPLGYTKPWIREETRIVSAGFTVCCKYPELDFSVLGFKHRMVGYLFSNEYELSKLVYGFVLKIKSKQKEVKEKVLQSSLTWDGELIIEENYHSISTKFKQTVILNHLNNVRFTRIFEAPHLRVPVRENGSFPEIVVDFDYAAINIHKHRKSVLLLFKMAVSALLYMPNSKQSQGLWLKIKNRYMVLKKTIIGVINMK